MALAAVRRATDDDVAEIVRIQADTWRLAYAGFVPEAALAELTSEAATQAWRDAVAAGEPFHVFVAEEGSHVVGFCAAAHYAGQKDLSIAEISTLLVEPRWGRRGHGGRLLATAAAALREAGSAEGRAWVPEGDTASRRFYPRAGWKPDGAVRTLDTGDGTLREIRHTGTLDLRLEAQ
ncbi:GNAT family N-acetyltransferase [Pseudonocardia ailaonensis]